VKNSFWLIALIATLLSTGNPSAQPNGSITRGVGMTTIPDLLPNCPSNHKTPLGRILSTDGKTWIVPAETSFQNGLKCSDLFNTCNGITPAKLSDANLSNVPVIEIDPGGDLITGYLFADNYFELFVNGVLVGVDPIPFTPFNSCVVKFRVKQPYTLAVKLADWEENPGLGSELNNGNKYHPGDGGFIAQFSDGTVTDASWRAQTFYLAPIENLNAVTELPDGTHSTASATTSPTCDANCYGVHYEIPSDWMRPDFDDSGWPKASLYQTSQVTNQAAFINFENTAWAKARFIWSSNLILDNLVLARKTIGTSSTADLLNRFRITAENPFDHKISLVFEQNLNGLFCRLSDVEGREVAFWPSVSGIPEKKTDLALPANLPSGIYFLQISNKEKSHSFKLIHQSF